MFKFRLNDRVIMHSTGKEELDDKYGVNLGICFEDTEEIEHYIILLDEPLETHRALVLPENCLDILH